ncbi:conserved Plasmodium protein, unknown function [Plasmodium gallinaceum]|uniref:TOG domain-containing protein n=1 Tax=Plasmodium gallinaceum TaxID=5849 RepID=A0A1J1GXD2_PLAGA|nr:conserved Plasmodium protein, unknown function [Plasmodium gallinaceum]CRG96950.1 conserved Plasmodium protein, unknown function [Plasmodium gallinaceum]
MLKSKMSSKDRDNIKLKYKILSISSNDKDYDILNILKNTGNKVHKPWLSEKNSIYPQEIILQIKPAKIKYLEFLSHEYTITKKIEIFVSNNNKDYSKVGFFRFNDNVSTSYCARELKYVYLPCTIKCAFIKLRLHKPYNNHLNTYSQIGLYYINVIPEETRLVISSEIEPSLYKLNSLSKKKIKNDNDNYNLDLVNSETLLRKKEITKNNICISDRNASENISDGVYLGSFRKSLSKCSKNKINVLYEKLENKIKCFENLKGECVAKEEFNKANELKKIVNTFVFLKNIITFLKGKKKKYVREENYGKAKRLKEKEIKIKIIIKNIEQLKIVNDCSKKWYYEWLVLYYKELEFYEEEINKIMSNENIKNIKKNCGIFNQNMDDNDNDINLNKILLLICSDDEKKREVGFDYAYKPFEDRENKKKNFWYNNIESLCLIIRRGISDSSYNIFVKSVVILEKMLTLFQDYFFNLVDTNSQNYTDQNEKYLKCIISSLLKRLDDSNLDVIDICIKTVMMMLHNNFTSFKNVFSIILSMLFYFFSADVTSEINEKIIVSLMSFYYSLINKYYTSVKNDINLKKILEIISLFLEVDLESIKQTSLDFFINIYNTIENRDELFEEFLLNVSFDTRNIIINRINQEEKEKIKAEENVSKFLSKGYDNNEKIPGIESEVSIKKCMLINDDGLLKKNTYLKKNYLKTKVIENENSKEIINETRNISDNNTEKNKKEDCETINKYTEDNKKVDNFPKLTLMESVNLKKEMHHAEDKDLVEKNIIENGEIKKPHNIEIKKKDTSHLITGNSMHLNENIINNKKKHDDIENKKKGMNDEDKVSDKGEFNADSTKIDENNEDHVPPFTCKYCYRMDEGFTEIGLEKHWIKKCPMLCACPNCFLIVELVVIYDHFLSECSHSYMYTSCEYCNKVVKKNLLDIHIMNECNGKKTEYLSCYYCSLFIESFEIDKWRAHFLSCSKNPRLTE